MGPRLAIPLRGLGGRSVCEHYKHHGWRTAYLAREHDRYGSLFSLLFFLFFLERGFIASIQTPVPAGMRDHLATGRHHACRRKDAALHGKPGSLRWYGAFGDEEERRGERGASGGHSWNCCASISFGTSGSRLLAIPPKHPVRTKMPEKVSLADRCRTRAELTTAPENGAIREAIRLGRWDGIMISERPCIAFSDAPVECI